MAQNNLVNFKIFLRDSGITDTRRINIEAAVVTSLLFLNEKLKSVFPVLKDSEYKITWKDADGDEITIASDEDLITALMEMTANVKVIYVTILQKTDDIRDEPVTVEADINFGVRVFCDVCKRTITGFRYKCLECPDYDLCRDCEYRGHHSDHFLVRLIQNEPFPRHTHKFIHEFARSMKRHARAMRKDGRFGKYCHRSKDEKGANRPEEPSGSAAAGEQELSSGRCPIEANLIGCPFSSGKCAFGGSKSGCPFTPAERISKEDFHALGASARQHLDPILNMFNVPGEAQTAGGEKPLIFDIIQSAVDGFFGRSAQQQSTQQQNDQNQQNQNQQAQENQNRPDQQNQHNQADSSQSQPQNQNSSQPQAPAFGADQNIRSNVSMPMDTDVQIVEGASAPPAQAPQSGNQDKPAEPGWSFVAQNPQAGTNKAPNSANGANQPTQPTPTLIYHPNPIIAEGLTRLHEMGFANDSGILTRLLERYQGDVGEVVKALVELRI